MDLTDSFTWEDLPTREADTGHLTAAGWIPRINEHFTRAVTVIVSIHSAQPAISIVAKKEILIFVWYPFKWTVSPFDELVNISQVTIFLR
jgi:hypothetical protein